MHISSVAKLRHGDFPTGFVVYICSLIAFVSGLVMTLMSLRMHKYAQITDPEELFLQSVDESWTKEVFFDKLIAQMVVATNVNSATNDKRAGNLAWASYSLLVGITLYGVVILLFTSM
ncbi:MAG TPA: hypothetical protein VKA80_05160 [Beijerinckiaceae bacterium]|nr:hypothetical protein [Beijerinckiaceae bacterium]